MREVARIKPEEDINKPVGQKRVSELRRKQVENTVVSRKTRGSNGKLNKGNSTETIHIGGTNVAHDSFLIVRDERAL